jgi:glutaredoxin 2
VSTPGKKKTTAAPLTPREKRDRKTSELMQSGKVISAEDARSAGLSLSMWRDRCDKNVAILERELSRSKQELKRLQVNIERLRELLKVHEGYRRAARMNVEG